jgi:hypothetical protein
MAFGIPLSGFSSKPRHETADVSPILGREIDPILQRVEIQDCDTGDTCFRSEGYWREEVFDASQHLGDVEDSSGWDCSAFYGYPRISPFITINNEH